VKSPELCAKTQMKHISSLMKICQHSQQPHIRKYFGNGVKCCYGI